MNNTSFVYRVFSSESRLFHADALEELGENPICLIFSILSFLFWVGSLAILQFRDRIIRQELEVEPLIDNTPLAEYFYQIIIYTGIQRNSGTTSDVGFRLVGTKGRTEAHLLKTRS